MNQDNFNTTIDFHIIPQYDPLGGCVQRLPSEIREAKFYSMNIIRDHSGGDLEKALNFQKSYSKDVCKCLEVRFCDNNIFFI